MGLQSKEEDGRLERVQGGVKGLNYQESRKNGPRRGGFSFLIEVFE